VVTEAANGPQALLELERLDVQLMLLDFAMPGMNGAEVAMQALDLKPEVKLLFLTGFSDSEAIDKAVDGRARVLKKPATAATLFAAIEEMLS
jgi:DNA-binding NarL/FixJ family response regulator